MSGLITNYDCQFYAQLADEVAASAQVCVPFIRDLLTPASVVDIGCGQGDWLHAFHSGGVDDILGVDGDYVDRASLRIPPTAFKAWDLTRPLELGRRFDLAVSLEVAEHLPESCAEAFVRQLVSLAPAVVFSAAIPGQGGTYHVNEQWFWYWQQLFDQAGYCCLDLLRKTFWRHPGVAAYYQQNMFLFVDPEVHGDLLDAYVDARGDKLTLVLTSVLRDLATPRKPLWRRVLGRVVGRIA
jgi:trans-aconitate methyltransferase